MRKYTIMTIVNYHKGDRGGVPVATRGDSGRTNQKLRTRMAIVDACRAIVGSGGPVTMPEVARAALVSEATAYRYYPDLASLLNAALVGMWPSPAEALAPVADSSDPVERIAFACEYLLRGVLAYQGGVRAMISATIARDGVAATARPGLRFGLIDAALAPIDAALPVTDPDRLARLKVDLAAVVSAEAFFSLIDLAGLTPDEAIASLVRTATTITEAALCAGPAPGAYRWALSDPGCRCGS
jgi:AcrR family transcriptional regulator